MDLTRGRTAERILVIEAPPRHGKSELISRHLPTWYLGRYPNRRVMLTSYGDKLARHFGRTVRDALDARADWFGINGVRADVKAADEWDLAAPYYGGMLTAGVGGPLTGRGCDLLIVDDPIKNAQDAISETVRDTHWDWFRSTALTRLEPRAFVVLMQTRWHEDDLAGRVIRLAGQPELEGFGVRRLHLPALAKAQDEMPDCLPDPLGREPGEPLWPERWPLKALQQIKATLGPYWWGAMYQQTPGQYGSAEWPDAYFGPRIWVDPIEWPDTFQAAVLFLDPSKGRKRGDYQAVVFLGLAKGKLWIDSLVDRWPLREMLLQLLSFHRTYSFVDRVGIEANHFQDLVADPLETLQAELGLPPLPIALVHNSVDKFLRISRLGSYLGRGAFRFKRTPGNERLVQQLKGFPLADHDDGPDALEGALRLLNHFYTKAKAKGRNGRPANR